MSDVETKSNDAQKLQAQYQRLEYEMHLIHQAGMELTRSLDVRLVGRRLFDFVEQLMDCISFVVSRYDDHEKLVRAVYVYHEHEEIDPHQFPPLPFDASADIPNLDRSTQGRAIKTGQSILIEDYDAYIEGRQSYYYDHDEGRIIESDSFDKEDGISRTRSALIVPLKLDERVTGVLQVMSYHLNAYTSQNLRILETIAPQVAIALQNARLFSATRSYVQRLELLQSIDQHILQGMDLASLSQVTLDKLQTILPFVRASCLLYRPAMLGMTEAELPRFENEQTWLVLAQVGQGFSDQALTCLAKLHADEIYYQAYEDIFASSAEPELCAERQGQAEEEDPHDTDEDDAPERFLCALTLTDQSLLGGLCLEFHDLATLDDEQRTTLQQVTAQLTLAVRDKQQRAAIQQHHQELDQRVRQRTQELESLLQQAGHLSEELRQAMFHEQALGNLKARMVSTVSHEFRTPLTVILSSANILDTYSERLSAEQSNQHIQRIIQQVNYLKGLLDDMILVGQVESNNIHLQMDSLNLQILAQECLSEIQSISPGYRMHFQLVGTPQLIYADATLIRQVLINLLTNAVKYSSAGSEVLLCLTYEDAQVLLEVTDQGIGIPPQDLPHLGEPFHRASNTGKIKGTGLGLAIVQRAVQAHHGDFQVISQVEHGTSIFIRLPVGRPSAP